MKPTKIITYIKTSRDRDNLQAIINAAEARDAILSNIEGKIRRKEMWKTVEKLGLKKGDTVFIHAGPTDKSDARGNGGFTSKKHANLWAETLTVKGVKTRNKEIVVSVNRIGDVVLSPFECASLKLSPLPTPEALAKALEGNT